MKQNFTERLIQLRKEDKKTQAEIAELLNIKRSTYAAYEKGTIVPNHVQDVKEKHKHLFMVLLQTS